MSEAAPSITAEGWPWGCQVAVKTISTLFWGAFVLYHMFVNKGMINTSIFFFYPASWGISKKTSIWSGNTSVLDNPPPPHFFLTPSFLARFSDLPPFPSILDKLSSRSLWMGRGLTMGWVISTIVFISPITLSPNLRLSTIQSLKVLCLHRSH